MTNQEKFKPGTKVLEKETGKKGKVMSFRFHWMYCTDGTFNNTIEENGVPIRWEDRTKGYRFYSQIELI